MTNRRFTDKPNLDPQAVRSLPPGHAALVENRTLFPNTVVEVTEELKGNLLVSGANNRKLGETVTKGQFKGYRLYGLTLEERATCPDECGARDFCYGNSMHLARRHRISDPDVFYGILDGEIETILADAIEGLMVRLHVLGDFPSVDYVAFWADMLENYDRLACYGYTHRMTTAWGGDEIGDAIDSVKERFPDRFRIRWSSPVSRPDGAVIVNFVPDKPRIEEGIVCPAQTDATACCASCGLCWDAKNDSIVFVKHGAKSNEALASSTMAVVEELSDADSFEAEVAKQTDDLRRYAIKLCKDPTLADDLVQETVAKALMYRIKFTPGTNLQAWLTTICRNYYLSTLRKSKREVDDPEGFHVGGMVSSDDTAERVEAREALGILEDLPEDQRNAIKAIADGMSYEDAAQKFNVNIGTVKSRVSRGRDAFRGMLGMESREPKDLPAAPPESRSIAAITLPPNCKPGEVEDTCPDVRLIDPCSLIVESAYQRDLSGKSIRMIRKIVTEWDWAKFKPPVCAETASGLFVIDGQHTAIAAATHPGIVEIPVMIVDAMEIEKRAEAFVSHNRDRLIMTPSQVFYGDVAAGNADAKVVLDAVIRAGGSIPRLPVQKGYAKVGQVSAVGELRKIGKSRSGPDAVERIVRIGVLSKVAPITLTVVCGLRMIIEERVFSDVAIMTDEAIASALASIKNLETVSQHVAAESGQSRYRACASLIADKARKKLEAAA